MKSYILAFVLFPFLAFGNDEIKKENALVIQKEETQAAKLDPVQSKDLTFHQLFDRADQIIRSEEEINQLEVQSRIERLSRFKRRWTIKIQKVAKKIDRDTNFKRKPNPAIHRGEQIQALVNLYNKEIENLERIQGGILIDNGFRYSGELVKEEISESLTRIFALEKLIYDHYNEAKDLFKIQQSREKVFQVLNFSFTVIFYAHAMSNQSYVSAAMVLILLFYNAMKINTSYDTPKLSSSPACETLFLHLLGSGVGGNRMLTEKKIDRFNI